MKDIRRIENLHVALWLLKDVSWCSSWKMFGVLMIAPTLTMAVYITWKTREIATELIHNMVVCAWICANITWMVGEFYWNDGTRGFARVFFYAGIVLLLMHYGNELMKKLGVRSAART